MRFVVLATGFDEALARDGQYDAHCATALRMLAATGRKLILATARDLRDLLEVFPPAQLFDYVIAENGGVLYQPALRRSAILARAPSEVLVQELRRRRVEPLAVGSSIVTTARGHERTVREAVARLGIDCRIVPNGHSLHLLPPAVSKASGVREALHRLGISAHNLVAIGAAETDRALFRLAEHAIALRNARPQVRASADRITHAEGFHGFLEIARELADCDLAYARPRRCAALGVLDGGTVLHAAPCGDSIVVAGPTGDAARGLCRYLVGQWHDAGYQCCVLATNTDQERYARNVKVVGDRENAPRLSDALSALEHAATSVVLDVSALPSQARRSFVDAFLVQLRALQARVGRPHAVIVQDAEGAAALPLSESALYATEMTRVYASDTSERLPSKLVERARMVIGIGGRASAMFRFDGLGWSRPLILRLPHGLCDRRARVWMRRGRLEPYATADDGECGTSLGRERASAAFSLDEASSLSG